jgi:3-hydroxybutyryl-CoA dehydrogenase
MQIAVLCNEDQKAELVVDGQNEMKIVYLDDIHHLHLHKDADAVIDLLFETDTERIDLLKAHLPKLIIINSVIDTLAEINAPFVRINAWNSFLNSELIEASTNDEELKKTAQQIFEKFNKKLEWLPDEPGFITSRVISMIINEAYFALSENVTTIDEIDIAMKLGTAYPYGPFEWGNRIGLQNIVTLLKKLSKKQPRYIPCELLVQETDKAI